MLWSCELLTGWRKTYVSLVTSRAKSPNVSVYICKTRVFFNLNTLHRLVRWICEGLSVAHALHYNMDF